VIGTIGDTSFPTTTQFTEWLSWAAGLVNTYIHSATDVADEGVTIKNIVDSLLWLKYMHELQAKRIDLGQVIEQYIYLPNKLDGTPYATELNHIYASRSTKRVAYNFNINTGYRQ